MQNVCGAFTMARNERLWLKVWLEHHASQLGQEACYVICEPNDPTVEEAKQLFPRAFFIEEPSQKKVMGPGHYDMGLELWRLDVVRRWQSRLLKKYSCVIFGDTDEMLAPIQGLVKYCEDVLIPSGRDRVRCCCWQPVQQANEPPVDRTPGSEVLAQRTKMWRLSNYDKTLLVRTPQAYARGFHYTYGPDGTGVQSADSVGRKRIADPVDERLPMVHMWRADLDDWLEDNSWRVGATRELAVEYFQMHIPQWATHSKRDADGEAVPVPEEWKRAFIIPG